MVMSNNMRSIHDAVSLEPFYPDLPQKKFVELLNESFVLLDAKILKGFNHKFADGSPDAVRMKLQTTDKNPAQFTTMASGAVVLNEVRAVLAKRMLPCLVYIGKRKSAGGQEYYTLDGQS
jgi:hypothetical protein